jgi:Ca2+-binding EF-hand superfamily protein
MNQGLPNEKLKLILKIYDRNKTKYLTREELENVLNNMFDLLNIHKPTNGLAKTIDTILIRTNFSQQDTKISWDTFSTYILNDSSLFQLLISNRNDGQIDDDGSEWLITRF